LALIQLFLNNNTTIVRALREENRILFNQMLSECKKKEYFDCVNSKGKRLVAESLFLILIFEQQKMINELRQELFSIGYVRTARFDLVRIASRFISVPDPPTTSLAYSYHVKSASVEPTKRGQKSEG
jgi:hypothetical protein